MRILVDTNILISAILFPNSTPARALIKVCQEHEMVLCNQNINELLEVVKRKMPNHLPDAEALLSDLSYEIIGNFEDAERIIRDPKDQPILNAAMLADIDLLITGDKDFLVLELDRPRCVTVAQFLENY